jgi:hypothetical protein
LILGLHFTVGNSGFWAKATYCAGQHQRFGSSKGKNMRRILLNDRCPLFTHHFVRALCAAGLLFFAVAAEADPRPPFPPAPENGVMLHLTFDFPMAWGVTNAQVAVPGVGFLVESFSGYALDRSGASVLPFIAPGVSGGHTNFTGNTAGAIRFWYLPYFTSASVTGGAGPGTTAHLADWVASSRTGTAVVWSLQISADGSTLLLLGYSDSGPVQLLSTAIAWTANLPHQIALDFGPQTALFIDGQVVAQGAGTVAIPPSVGELVLGSSLAGDGVADGQFDEFFSFDHALSPFEIAWNYAINRSQAALGPVSAKELAEENDVGGLTLTRRTTDTKVYDPDNSSPCSPGGPVYLTNFSASLEPNGTTTISFGVSGGTNGVFADVYYLNPA